MNFSLHHFRKRDVPSFLHGSSFYDSLSGDDEDDLTNAPIECCKFDDVIDDIVQLKHCLQTMRYWGLNYYSLHTLNFVFEAEDREVLGLVKDLEPEPGSAAIVELVKMSGYNTNIEVAAKAGRLDLLHYLVYAGYQPSEQAVLNAIIYGNLDCLRCVCDSFDWSNPPVNFMHKPCQTAAECGRLSCLQYVFELGCTLDSKACALASTNGYLDCLRYCLAHTASREASVTTAAANGGHLHCLQFAFESGCPLEARATTEAADGEHFDCVKYLYEHGCAWDGCSPISAAAFDGNLEMVQYMHERGCPLDTEVTFSAAHSGNIEVIKYVVERGCPISEAAYAECACTDCVEGLIYLYAHRGAEIDETYIYLIIANFNAQKCLAYMQSEHPEVPILSNMSYFAARGGHVGMLQFAHEHGGEISERVALQAARSGSVECLKYLHEHDCPWSVRICVTAAGNGKLDCLRYAHENGCPWDKSVTWEAGETKQLDCLVYAVRHGCEVHGEALTLYNSVELDCCK